MRSSCVRLLLSLLSIGLLFASSAAQATLVGPTSYTGYASGPFGGLGLAVEDFEDGALNTPGVSASAGSALGPAFGLTDSVENAPDGCNPSGAGGGAHSCTGWSYYAGGGGTTTITFTFSGPLPTHAGIVWTDVGYLLSDSPPNYTGVGTVLFEAFDQFGASLGTIAPGALGDGIAAPMAGEDVFFGAIDSGGISKITLSMPQSDDWEMDHLQFGTPLIVPEPGSAGLVVLGLSGLAVRGRRRG
jgi:hypothetical protein